MKEYKVTGMSCGHCEKTVRTIALKHGAGADTVIDLATGLVRFEEDDTFNQERFMEAVADAGYDIEPVAPPQTLGDQTPKTSNTW